MDDKYIVAIDLGTFKISLAVALQDGTDTRLIYYKETPASGMKSSRILTELRVVGQLKQAIRDAEDILGIKITGAVVGMPRFYIKTEENEEIRLVVNNARRDGDYNELGIGSALIDGSYEVDATATNADKTFSIKTTDGHELYYTTILAGEKEISVIDGEINISTAEDGTVTITAILVDAAEALHRYSYQGKIEVVDASYGGNAESPAFYNTYNTYYTTKANEWDVQIYISEDGKKPEEYVRYASIHFFGPAGETDGKELPEGKFTLAVPPGHSC